MRPLPRLVPCLLSALSLMSSPAPAIELLVWEYDKPESPKVLRLKVMEVDSLEKNIVQRIEIADFLRWNADGEPELNVHRNNARSDDALVELLRPGLPTIDSPETRKEIATLLASIPAMCHDNAYLWITVMPIEGLDRLQSGVTDTRRIYRIGILDCTDQPPDECGYSMADSGSSDFDLGSLAYFIDGCKSALERDKAHRGSVQRTGHPV